MPAVIASITRVAKMAPPAIGIMYSPTCGPVVKSSIIAVTPPRAEPTLADLRQSLRDLPCTRLEAVGSAQSPSLLIASGDTGLPARIDALGGISAADPTWRWHFVPHHLCHQASAFLAAPYERCAVMTLGR